MGAGQSSDSYSTAVIRGDDVKTMENFDINRYIGTAADAWYEIAHTGGSDKHQCNNAMVKYEKTASPRQFIVHNICYVNRTPDKTMSGTMTMPDPNVPSKLKVKFDQILGKEFDYWVFFTDYDNYSLVGSSSGHYWILGRKPQVGLCVVRKLQKYAESKGLGKGKKLVMDLNAVIDCDADEKQFTV